MAIDYSKRLVQMRERRQGTAESTRKFTEHYAYSSEGFTGSTKEAYENRSRSESTKYALGAMQAVDPEYTKVSIAEGDRVKQKLSNGLYKSGISTEFEYQGSVPLDIHIKRHSDIDLLVLDSRFVTCDHAAALTAGNQYGKLLPKSAAQYLIELRRNCERILIEAYPAANVNTSGAKSINLSGDSFQRKVDVVPSHWHDSATYQRTRQKHDRVVQILDKIEQKTIPNLPFLHIKKVNDKDKATLGGTKKVIRFLKTLKADCDQDITLSSYDIASLVWHFNDRGLAQPTSRELALIAVARAELNAMCRDYSGTCKLTTPDGSRKIIDKPEKFTSLQKLSAEVDAIASDIARELDPMVQWFPDRIRPALEAVSIR
ncbi:hypothetical protein [Rhodospirillum centenum]|uniref:hypothetical protein n=1 Tax=Rhodospirillum centenum TaxID=34018 RepID=UPI0011D160D6|nr:hypothetical protein [Rhodospirillum centenum]